ncbi:MAG: HipA domain-containing protein [Phascolarctobacterium sp.]|nr:HipA domain-containing protein [Phascolarctobacterium sp.]
MNFTQCKRILAKAYSGANGKKIAIEYNGKQYMLKFPPSGKNKPTDLSYTNSCFSEHIGSTIFNMLGIDAQKTMLGTYFVGNKEKIVCACEDFTADGSILYDFCSIKNTIIDSEHEGAGTELDDLLETIEKQQFVNPETLLDHFWNVFIVDALLGNFDRHNGNWGFLYQPANDSTRIAPVFDCGSCLLPQADEKVMVKVLQNVDELNARIYRFPTSAIHYNGKKINYYDFLTLMNDENCGNALERMIKRIDLNEINAFIDQEEYLSPIQKEFYKYYISARYEKILKNAFKKSK